MLLSSTSCLGMLLLGVVLIASDHRGNVLLAEAQEGKAADPTCSTGIEYNGACCPRKCGRCGGTGCYARTLANGVRCCADGINRASPSCNLSGPPCRIVNSNTKNDGGDDDGGPGRQQSEDTNTRGGVGRSSTSTVNGFWRHAFVSSGALVKRHEACAVMLNGLVVLLGGRGVNKQPSIYNPKTKAWRRGRGPGAGVEIHHCQCVAVANRVWIVSSWRGNFPFEQNNEAVYVYIVGQDRWVTRKGMASWRLRGGAAAVLHHDWIYVVGGNRGGHGSHAVSLPWMDAYNWRRNFWTMPNSLPNMPGGGRDHVGGAIVKNQLCIAGGRNGGVRNFSNANRASTYCYNFALRRWFVKPNMPVPRAGAMTGSTCDGRMMIAGGEGRGMAFSRVDVFDGSKWEPSPPSLVRARHGSGLAVAHCSCGHIFIPSGSGGQGASPELYSTEQYIPSGARFTCFRY